MVGLWRHTLVSLWSVWTVYGDKEDICPRQVRDQRTANKPSFGTSLGYKLSTILNTWWTKRKSPSSFPTHVSEWWKYALSLKLKTLFIIWKVWEIRREGFSALLTTLKRVADSQHFGPPLSCLRARHIPYRGFPVAAAAVVREITLPHFVNRRLR